MSAVLRRQALSAKHGRSLLDSTYRTSCRNARTTPISKSLASHTTRLYSSQPPENHKNERESKESKDARTPGKAAKGFENMFNNNSPISPPPQGDPKDPKKSNYVKLSTKEEKALDDMLENAKKGLPKALIVDVELAFSQIKKNGIPKEIREMMQEISSSKNGMTLSQAAKLIRITSRYARQAAEEVVKEEEEAAAAKKTGQTNSKSESGKEKEKKGSGEQFKVHEFKFDASTLLTAAFTAYLLYRLVIPSDNTKDITWQEFKTSFLDKGLVDKLVVTNKSSVKVHLHRDAVAQQHPDSPAVHPNFFYVFSIGSVEAFERKLDAAQDDLGIPSHERVPVSYSDEVPWTSTLVTFGYLFLPLFLIVWLQRRMGGAGGGGGQSGIFGMGKSRAKKFNHETDIKIRFKDVAGMDEAKQEIMEFVSFLKEPEQFQRLGAKIPRGAILSGPPGTGKTLLAKATAGESQVPFFSVSGSEFVEMFVGVGASRVRDLFANARKSTPCIIFIDEIDAIGKSRSKQQFGGGNDEREATLNQILTEMDGFNTSEQVVVLAGTNRPDVLDSALMRPGRFDRHIGIDRPTMEGRKQIFGVHLGKIITDEDMENLKGRLAALTPGFSGADIANACNEAALIAARSKADKVRMTHFEQAIERTIGGLEKKSLVLSPEEKKVVAYHEAGHAICGWYFKYADPLLKVSIIPRGQGALGYAQYLPDGDTYLMNVNQLMDRMAMTLGGRVSEELNFETVTSGASDDFKKVTRMAAAMVTKWGMSNKIGYLYFEEDQNQFSKPFSEETARNIDAEVRRIVDEAYKQCKDLLTEKKKEVEIVAEELLKNEVLSRDDMIRLLGKRPFESKGEFEKYFGGEGSKSAPPPPPTESGRGIGDSNIPPTPGPAPVAYKRFE